MFLIRIDIFAVIVILSILTALTLPEIALAQQDNPPSSDKPSTDKTPTDDSSAQPEPKASRETKFRVGPEFKIFIPTSGETRKQFGDSWSGISVGLGKYKNITEKGAFSYDFSLINAKKGENRAYIAPIGLVYNRAITGDRRGYLYVGGSLDAVITQLRIPSEDIPSRIRGTVGASFFTGVRIGESGYIQARYYQIGKIHNYDLSGLSLSVGARF